MLTLQDLLDSEIGFFVIIVPATAIPVIVRAPLPLLARSQQVLCRQGSWDMLHTIRLHPACCRGYCSCNYW